jgi:hypothetical protein
VKNVDDDEDDDDAAAAAAAWKSDDFDATKVLPTDATMPTPAPASEL